MNNFIEHFKVSLSENKHLYFVSLFTFLLIYLSTFNKAYGYFIDEFYYIACANNPAFGYVDHPPLSPLVLTIFQFVFGTSVYAIRFLPALAAASAVFYTGILTKEIGGNKFAQFLAACSLAAMPVTIAFGTFYSMNAFEPLLAVLLLLLTTRMIKSENYKPWIPAGVIMGLGVMNKHTFGVFIIAFLSAIILSGKWKLLFNKWFVIGGLIGFLIFLPNIIWQILNNFPSLEFYRNISADKNVYTPPFDFIMGQVMYMSPSIAPVWFMGTFYLLFSNHFKNYRFLSILFAGLFIFMMLSGTSRPDRLAFAYPAAFAGGALFFETILSKFNLRFLKVPIIIFLFSGLVLSFPILIPYFSYDFSQKYTEWLGINTELEKGKKPPLHQIIADRIGWEEKVNLVINAYNSLSEEEKAQTIIAAGNYGQAGAIELFGKPYNLPPVACSHNNYYLWSKDRVNGSILLQLDNERDYSGLKNLFDSVEIFPGKYTNKYVSDQENNLVVFICRGPKIPPMEMLERSKNYH
uniref:Glycosyltransferase RgtA/B/C/D-like domain-containing protein n=1 Tax=Ignavibacterium album TaxID=591197 RepID=A0A832G8J0_9BACT